MKSIDRVLERSRVRKFWIEAGDHRQLPPKRGDLVYTNVGRKLERTWLVLRVKPMRPRTESGLPRHHVLMARWWELLPSTRMRLFESACRHGGQEAIAVYPLAKKKKKQTFEQFMRRSV